MQRITKPSPITKGNHPAKRTRKRKEMLCSSGIGNVPNPGKK